MDIKTLEHYAIVKIQDLEAQVAKLTSALESATLERDTVTRNYGTLIDHLKNIASHKQISDTAAVSFSSVYDKWNKEEYDYFVGVLDFPKE